MSTAASEAGLLKAACECNDGCGAEEMLYAMNFASISVEDSTLWVRNHFAQVDRHTLLDVAKMLLASAHACSLMCRSCCDTTPHWYMGCLSCVLCLQIVHKLAAKERAFASCLARRCLRPGVWLIKLEK